MFNFFYNRKVEITIIVVFLALIFASTLMQLPNGNEGSENSGESQSKTEGETYSVIGNLSFGENACTIDDFGDFTVDYSKITNSAINNVPEGVSKKDWKELLGSITYSAGLTDGDIKDGAKIPIIASLGEGQEEAFCKKYKCHIAQLDDKYTAKVNGFDNQMITVQMLESSRKDLLQAAEQRTKRMAEEYMQSTDSFTGQNYVFYMQNADEREGYLTCCYTVQRNYGTIIIACAIGPIYGNNLTANDILTKNEYDTEEGKIYVGFRKLYEITGTTDEALNQIKEDGKNGDLEKRLYAVKIEQIAW